MEHSFQHLNMASSDNDNDFTADIVFLLRQAESLLSGQSTGQHLAAAVCICSGTTERGSWLGPPIIFLQYIAMFALKI